MTYQPIASEGWGQIQRSKSTIRSLTGTAIVLRKYHEANGETRETFFAMEAHNFLMNKVAEEFLKLRELQTIYPNVVDVNYCEECCFPIGECDH